MTINKNFLKGIISINWNGFQYTMEYGQVFTKVLWRKSVISHKMGTTIKVKKTLFTLITSHVDTQLQETPVLFFSIWIHIENQLCRHCSSIKQWHCHWLIHRLLTEYLLHVKYSVHLWRVWIIIIIIIIKICVLV